MIWNKSKPRKPLHSSSETDLESRWHARQWNILQWSFAPNSLGILACHLTCFWSFREFSVALPSWWIPSISLLCGLMFAASLIGRYLLTDSKARHWLLQFYSTVMILSILIWCYIGGFHYPSLPEIGRSIYSTVTAGLAAGGIVLSLHSRITGILVGSLYMLPYSFVTLGFDDHFGKSLGFLGIVYWTVVLTMALLMHYLVRQDFLLSQTNEQLLAELKANTKAMLQSSKLSSLGEMAGGIAHEINNPLAILSGAVFKLKVLLQRLDCIDAESQSVLDKMEATIQRAMKITTGLLNFARDGNQEEKDSEDLWRSITDAVDLTAKRLSSHGVELRLLPAKEEVLFAHNSVQISQVVLNFINNAFDAIRDSEDRWIEIELGADSTHYIIRITDSGLGIPESIREKIFDPFYTTKAVGKGTGLGLSVSLGIIDHHQGRIEVNAASKNTEFLILLPKSEPTTERQVS